LSTFSGRATATAHRIAATAREVWPGLLTALTIATAAAFVSSRYGGPALVFALLLGMAFNFLSDNARTAPGIEFTAKRVLRLGVALLGARIGLEQILALGWLPVVLIAAMVPATILLGRLVAARLGESGQMGLLTGGAVAICGASAAMAIASVLPASDRRERDTLFTVVGVTTLSTVCMVIYPAILSLFELTDVQAGYIIGASVHDVAQVVGAGYVISDPAGDAATLTKLMRVAMLIPTTLLLAYLFARTGAGAGAGGGGTRAGVKVPGFLIGFVALAVATNLGLLPGPVVQAAETGSKWCLIVAIAALGVKTVLKELLDLGWKPLVLMLAETVFMVTVVAAVVLIAGGAFIAA
jgi:uncharacterized integral membrane protein (TIGR00698 family)